MIKYNDLPAISQYVNIGTLSSLTVVSSNPNSYHRNNPNNLPAMLQFRHLTDIKGRLIYNLQFSLESNRDTTKMEFELSYPMLGMTIKYP